MARVTVEDCIMNIPNRFELVVVAAGRAKQIASGSQLTVDRDNDKDAVVSLREIADKTIDIDEIREDIVLSYCKKQEIDRPIKSRADIEEILSEEGETIDDVTGLSLTSGDKSELSFESDNIDVED